MKSFHDDFLLLGPNQLWLWWMAGRPGRAGIRFRRSNEPVSKYYIIGAVLRQIVPVDLLN
jgi:hypothetical protein